MVLLERCKAPCVGDREHTLYIVNAHLLLHSLAVGAGKEVPKTANVKCGCGRGIPKQCHVMHSS